MDKTIAQAIIQAYRDSYPDGLVPPQDAAHILRLQASYLATLRSRGGGPAYIRMGGRIFYHLEDLAQWFESRSTIRG